MASTSVTVDISSLYAKTGTAKLAELPAYEEAVLALVGKGRDVVLTGPGPVWLYLRLAHRLHGVARHLAYWSPAIDDDEVVIFDHDPY